MPLLVRVGLSTTPPTEALSHYRLPVNHLPVHSVTHNTAKHAKKMCERRILMKARTESVLAVKGAALYVCMCCYHLVCVIHRKR